MTAFSGGNRWVGVVALAEPPVPTPLHKIAAFRRAIKRLERIRVSPQLEISRRRFCRILQQLAEGHALADNIGRAAYYLSLANAVNREGAAHRQLPNWVLNDVAHHLNREVARPHPMAMGVHKSKRIASAGHPEWRKNPALTRSLPPGATRKQEPPRTREFVVIDNSDLPCLGDPGQWADGIPLSEGLVKFLAQLGWDARIDTVRSRWLRIACMHASYIYENERALSIGVNSRLLKSFEEVGKRWITLALLDCYVAECQPKTRGAQSSALNDLKSTGNRVIDDCMELADAVILGKGESATSGNHFSRARSVTVRQVLGVVALLGGVEAIRQLCQSSYVKVRAALSRPREWRTLLEGQTRKEPCSWSFSEEGPAHNRMFTACVQDDAGRYAEGVGRGKKEAAQKAAENFLRRYLPAVVARQERDTWAVSAPRPPLIYRNAPAGHRQAVRDLRQLFDLPVGSEPWLCQALTHSSWAYENKVMVADARQRDNGLLAHHGSFVMDSLCTHEHVLRLAATNLRPNEDEARMGTPDNYFCQELFDRLAVGGGVLLSKGQADNPDIAKADVAQAVLAAAWRHRRTHLMDTRPAELHEWLGRFAPVHDGYTKLVNMGAPYGVEVDSIAYESGPDHERRYAVDLIFKSHGAEFTLECDYRRASKSQAKARSAGAVVDLLRTYQDYPADLDGDEKRFISYYVGSQIANAAAVEDRNLQRCVLQGHLGLSALISGEMRAFRRWAGVTSDIVAAAQQADLKNLQSLYARCISQFQRRSLPMTANRIAAFVVWLEALDRELEVEEFAPLSYLAEFSRCVIPDEAVDLSTVVATSAGSRYPNTEEKFDPGAIFLAPIQATIVAMLLTATARWSTSATAIDLGGTEDGALVLVHGLTDGFEECMGPLAELLAELSPSVTCYLNPGDLLIRMTSEEPSDEAEVTSIERAARAALDSASEARHVLTILRRHVSPIVEQIRVFETARTASETDDRTDRYRYLSDASEALDAMSPHVNALKRLANSLADQ